MTVSEHIREKFRIKGFEVLPFTGWFTRGPAPTREMLAELFYEVGYKIGAEIGVRTGEFSNILLKKNPDSQFILH